MTDRLVRLPLSMENLHMVTTPEVVHKAAMRVLPDLSGTSTAIRRDTATVFRVDLPNDALGSPGVITMRWRGPVLPTDIEAVDTPELVDGCRIVARIAAESRPEINGRSQPRPVEDHRAPEWVAHLLERHGLGCEELHLSPARPYGQRRTRPRGPHFTVRDLVATITCTDPALARHAFAHGIGRGRAYGLGMIVALPTSALPDPAPSDSVQH